MFIFSLLGEFVRFYAVLLSFEHYIFAHRFALIGFLLMEIMKDFGCS